MLAIMAMPWRMTLRVIAAETETPEWVASGVEIRKGAGDGLVAWEATSVACETLRAA
jgi:hypothetical protein